MPGIEISSLPPAPSAQLTDVFPIDQLPGPVTYKLSSSQLLSLFQTQIAANGQPFTKTDDTNVTMTLGGSPSIALLNAMSVTLGWTGLLSSARGGTGVNNGTNTLTLTGNLSTVGNFPAVFNFTASTNVTFPTTGTLATTAMIPIVTPSALTKTDDTNVTLTLGGLPATALLQATSLTLGWTGQLSLTRGGTNASLTASNGGIVYSTGSALAILTGTATAGKMLQSGASTTPAWSTSTYPATNAINTLLYASAANVMSALATANNGILITSASGVPSIGTTVGSGLTMPSITFNSTTGIVGTTTNNNAAAGSVGEFVISVVSSVAISNNTLTNVTSISLTAGDWDVWGNIITAPAAATTQQGVNVGINTTTATLPSQYTSNSAYVANNAAGLIAPTIRLSLSGTTTVYLVSVVIYSISTLTISGTLNARRRR